MFKFWSKRKTDQAVPEAPSNRRILLAEDDTLSQIVTSQMLMNEGYQVQIASNGHEVISLLESDDFDLVVMDCSMPEMDGFTATKVIRSESTSIHDPHIPIIALTALAMEGDREKCLAAGMNEYLSKPVDSVELVEMVGKCLARSKISQSDKSIAQSRSASDPDEKVTDSFEPVWDAGTFDMIMDMFTSEIPDHISDLQSALAERDFKNLEEISHKLRGSAALIGAGGLSEASFTLNKAMRFGDFSNARENIEELINQLELLLQKDNKECRYRVLHQE